MAAISFLGGLLFFYVCVPRNPTKRNLSEMQLAGKNVRLPIKGELSACEVKCKNDGGGFKNFTELTERVGFMHARHIAAKAHPFRHFVPPPP